MASLRDVDGAEHLLVARHIVGRSRVCLLRLEADEVSGVHAEFVWDEGSWWLRDLGSRNGTFLEGRRLTPGELAPLREDARVGFGAPELLYRVISLEPPRLTAVAADGERRYADDELLALPDDVHCAVMIFRDCNDGWVVEDEREVRALAPEDELEVDGRRWRLFPPRALPRTRERAAALSLSSIALELAVSRDQEHVELALVHAGRRIELETRAHAGFLLHLARARLRDAGQHHLASSEHGWRYRDELMGEFGVSLRLLNLWVFRARKQLAELGVEGASALIERRPDAQQLRIGVRALTIRDA